MSITPIRPNERLRDAVADDAAAITRLLRAANAEYEALLPPAIYAAYLDDLLDLERRRLEEAQFVVAEGKGDLAGCVAFYTSASREGMGLPEEWASFRSLAVDPRARGLGIGRDLIRACVERARAENRKVLGMHTGAFMKNAVTLYESLGFERCPEYDTNALDWLELDIEHRPIHAIAYRLEL
jgi:GNAT superfamily N-acetyltransferase